MKLLVVAKNKDEFEEFARWQVSPKECVYVDNEVVFYSNPRTFVVLLPMWYHNPAYAKIHDIKKIIDMAMKGARITA